MAKRRKLPAAKARKAIGPVIKKARDAERGAMERCVRIEGLDGSKCLVSAKLNLDGSLDVAISGRRRCDVSIGEPER